MQKFLLLDELVKSHVPLTQEETKEASVEIQDLICYWDKVSAVGQAPLKVHSFSRVIILEMPNYKLI